ncbi:MAG: putative transposase [Granulosicoccus sp.]|jgi:putative transposase
MWFRHQNIASALQRFRELRSKLYWGNHIWTKGYCVDTVGLDFEKIQAYVWYQDKKDQQIEQQQLGL